MYQDITSKDNKFIKQLVKLGQSRDYREELGYSVIFGVHLIEEAIKYGVLVSLVVDEQKITQYQSILSKLSREHIYVTQTKILQKINLLESSIDIVGVVRIIEKPLDSNLYKQNCIVLEKIQDPGNLGSIMRVAKAAGVSDIVLSQNSVDAYNPKVLRSSQGAVFGVNIYSSVDVFEFITNYLGKVIATTPIAAKSLYMTNLNEPVAWVFGNEGSGLSQEILDKISCHIAIPMHNDTESLNLAMAVSVCLFEQLRQRSYS